MGEIADMMIEGEICSECGVIMLHVSGVPGLCRTCWKEARKRAADDRKNQQRKRQGDRTWPT